MFCSRCRYHLQRSDSFCSGCGTPIRQQSASWPDSPASTELARDARFLTGSRRAMKFAMIPLILVVVLVAIGGALVVLFGRLP